MLEFYFSDTSLGRGYGRRGLERKNLMNRGKVYSSSESGGK